MSAPTASTRAAVYGRDDRRCVACHTETDLTFQHRRAVGMGGSKNRPTVVDGITLCLTCNQRCEADLQTMALAYGWKVRKWADPSLVPVYYPHDFGWFLLPGTRRRRVSGPVALDAMAAVYGHEHMTWYREVTDRGVV